jgi:hypothetical protein
MQQKSFYVLVTILIFLVCSGCSNDNRPKDFPRLYPVTLTITQDDQPLDNALVLLYAENEVDARWTVGSRTDAQGKAIIMTHGQFRGSPAGKFKVCVMKSESSDAGTDASSPAPLSVYGDMTNTRSVVPKITNLVDPLFANPKSTPLEIEVLPKGTTNLTLSVHKP